MIPNQFQDIGKNSTADQAKWWESSEDHRFALEVLQLPQRRRILRFLAGGLKTREEIEAEFSLSSTQAEYHLSMLEKALVVERAQSGFKATQTGMLYLERVDVK
ncbi:MAG: helix-turn-helix domain-containing protein [Methanothrix sp.]